MSDLPRVTELVPHQPPVLALEQLTAWHPGHAVGRLTVRADNVMLEHGRVDSAMTLEYMAQCVAACLGMDAYRGGGNVRVGMVIACRRLELAQPTLELGHDYEVRADEVRATDGISHYDGEVRGTDGQLVASCTMTLVHGEKPPE